jgi:outer membrane protein assembly factor BamD
MRRLGTAALFFVLWGCGHRATEPVVTIPGNSIREPDKVLYEQAIKDLRKGRFNISRLTLQTLINTYPDSEFLPEAKYALAESFYREGTSSNLTQAETEFKDFITFFPTSDRADDAQMMIAMTHIRQLEKPDRDSTQALLAETELKRMIESYPDSPLLDEAKGKLISVQEVLADGVFKIANQYYGRHSYIAAISRYKEVLDKYPDYTRTSDVLFNLADSLHQIENPESAVYYAKIVSEHPRYYRVPVVKSLLSEMKQPIPEANPAALVQVPNPKNDEAEEHKGILQKVFAGILYKSPVSTDTNASAVKGSVLDKTDTIGDSDSGGSLKIENKPTKRPQ